MNKYTIFIAIIMFSIVSCISKKREGISIEIHNDTPKDIFIMDEYIFYKNGYIELFDKGYDIKRKHNSKFLKNNYITKYTIKDIFYSQEEFKNQEYIYIYIISQDHLEKKKEYIRKEKLYDSIKVYINKERQEIYYYN